MKVGFIGLGVMGSPMALNVLKGGHELTVYDRRPEALEPLVAAGARAATSPREVGAASQIVVTMLPEPQHVEQVVLGDDGIAAGMAAGGIVIDMSTIDELFAPQFLRGGPLTAAAQAAMAERLGADSLAYLPLEAVARSIGLGVGDLCQACLTGDYPTPAGERLYEIALGQTAAGGRTYETSTR